MTRFRTVLTPDGPRAAGVTADGAVVLASTLLGRSIGDLLELIRSGQLQQAKAALEKWDGSGAVDFPSDAPMRNPGLILGIGLNYRAHAGDLGADLPRASPASFIKGAHTIVGPGETIRVPRNIGRVTAEAELGLVFGTECYRVSIEDALSYIAGVCAVLDQTAEEVLLENPRYLTRVKNYPTFLSFGPELITLDEVEAAAGSLADLRVTTVRNGECQRSDTVAGMTFSPAELISFHSQMMPFQPGDLLLTGTPGAIGIRPGDTVQCELGHGLALLSNPVDDEK